jgi:hypothetical protein
MFKLLGMLLVLVMTAASATAEPPIADPVLIEDLVAANRILYDQGVVDGFGHVSVRHDKDAEHFLLARSMAPGLVTATDIMEFDRDGNAIDPKGRAHGGGPLGRVLTDERVETLIEAHENAFLAFASFSPLRQPFFLLVPSAACGSLSCGLRSRHVVSRQGLIDHRATR